MFKRKASHETEAPVKRMRVSELPIPSVNLKEDASMVKGEKRKDHGECSPIPAKKRKLFDHVPNDGEQASSSTDTRKKDEVPVMLHLPRIHCPYHPYAHLLEDYAAGDMICSECGLVVVDRCIDVAAEWRMFSDEKAFKDPSRVGNTQSPLLSGRDLTTMISNGTGSASFDESGKPKYQNRQTKSSSDQAMLNAFEKISTMADRIHLPGIIVDRANSLFKRVYELKLHTSRGIDRANTIASACLYIACRQERAPRTFKDICAVSELSKKEIGRYFLFILRKLEISLDPMAAEDLMPRFCSNLGLPKLVQKVATFIARKVEELDLLPGRCPISVAAAAIYMASQASGGKTTRKEIGDMVGVADVTIRQCYQLICGRAAELFPPDFNRKQIFSCCT